MDYTTREMEEKTYDANGVLQIRKHFLLNEHGQPTQGNIYDGKNNLVARAMLIFDAANRAKEMRTANLAGEVFQQVIYEYDASGKAKTPKVVNLNVRTPTFKPATIDFTQSTPAPGTPQAVMPDIPTNAPGTLPTTAGSITPEPAAAPAAEGPQKKSFWKRLFHKQEKK
jgi:hypothetical protein